MTTEMNEFNDFLKADKNAPKLPEQAVRSIESRFSKELVHSPRQLIFVYLAMTLIGYIVTLFVCAQHTIGIFDFSHSISGAFHSLPAPWCPLICGALFTGIPFLISLFFLSRFQQRFLFFKHWIMVSSIPLVTVFVILAFSQLTLETSLATSTNDLPIALWTLSAVLTPTVLGLIVYIRLRKKKVR